MPASRPPRRAATARGRRRGADRHAALAPASLQAWPRHPGLYRPLARTSAAAAAACLGVGAARPAPLLLGLALVLLLAIPWALAVTVFAHSKFGEDNESPGDAS